MSGTSYHAKGKQQTFTVRVKGIKGHYYLQHKHTGERRDYWFPANDKFCEDRGLEKIMYYRDADPEIERLKVADFSRRLALTLRSIHKEGPMDTHHLKTADRRLGYCFMNTAFDFMVMDRAERKNWKVRFSDAGFGTEKKHWVEWDSTMYAKKDMTMDEVMCVDEYYAIGIRSKKKIRKLMAQQLPVGQPGELRVY
mgnify:FL=1